MQTVQSWASGGTEIKIALKGVGVTTMGVEAADLTDATIAQDTMTRIRDIVVTGGRTAGMTEVDTEETVGPGRGPPKEGPDPGRGITRDGGGPKKG